ncbi:MAG: hypothetical protein ACNA7X_04260 [Dehalococcoidia bacterium]
MSQQLGKIERLEAEHFRRGKKLYLVPLVYSGDEAPDEYREKHSRYWQQAAEQLSNLASQIGDVKRVYHELIYQSGKDGIEAVERINPGSHQIARTQCGGGAAFEPLEEKELLEEVMDWQRCLMIGFVSHKVERKVFDLYLEASRKRDQSIANKIQETLGEDEAGLLFIREGHSVQFPSDVEVFSVVPPALDEIHRWYRDRSTPGPEKKEKPASEEDAGEARDEATPARKTTTRKSRKKS